MHINPKRKKQKENPEEGSSTEGWREAHFLLHHLFCILLLFTPHCLNYRNKNAFKFLFVWDREKSGGKQLLKIWFKAGPRKTWKQLLNDAEPYKWKGGQLLPRISTLRFKVSYIIKAFPTWKAGGTTNMFFSNHCWRVRKRNSVLGLPPLLRKPR